MSRDIAGSGATGNRLEWTGQPAIDTADWSIAQWIFVRSATNLGCGLVTQIPGNTTNSVQTLRPTDSTSSTKPFVRQGYTTTDTTCTSGTALTTSKWYHLVGLFDSTGAMGTANRCHIFQGALDAAMVQPSETLVAPSGSRRTGATTYIGGNSVGHTSALNGIIGLTVVYNRLITLDEAEGIRNGMIPGDYVFLAALDDGDIAQNVDLISSVNGTVTGAAVAVAEDPPVPYTQPQAILVPTL